MRAARCCDSPSVSSSETTSMEDVPRRRKRNTNHGNNSRSTPKVSRKVHSNINFSKLDEVCLDVGKVDLSHSARLKNDLCLSPQKMSSEVNEDVQFEPPNGHLEERSRKTFIRKTPEKPRNMRCCYVELECLETLKGAKRNIFPTTREQTSQAFTENIPEAQGWRGWLSKITSIESLRCQLVSIKDNDAYTHVLVFDDNENEQSDSLYSVEPASPASSEELSLSSDDSACAIKKQKITDSSGSQHSNSSVHDIFNSSRLDLQVPAENQSLHHNGYTYNLDSEHLNLRFLKRENESSSDDYDGFLGWDAAYKEEAEKKRQIFMQHYQRFKSSNNIEM